MSGRVLVVDDDASMRDMLQGDLGERGFTVTVSPDAAEALERLATAEVDAIVTDLNMPRMNGVELCERIVAQYATIWNGQGEPDVLARKNRILDEWCAKVGRDPNEIERSAQIFRDQLDKLDEYYAGGITHFICGAPGPDYDLTELRKLIAWRDSHSGHTS